MSDYMVLKGKRYEIEEANWIDWVDGDESQHEYTIYCREAE